jgi:2-polyprenyl-3-methyl-5-hydroxy-6-metoxy-1,4-benzoquinol methylase
MEIGIQKAGLSSEPIYTAALRILEKTLLGYGAKVADVGGGRGTFARRLLERGFKVTLFDHDPPNDLDGSTTLACNLNSTWPSDRDFDCAVALEVIEHVENPRHFFREMCRIVKPWGLIMVSTPNQHSLASKMCFLLRDEHQSFQDSSYPAHITPLLEVDLRRIAAEVGATQPEFFFTDNGRIPGTKMLWQRVSRSLSGRRFSDNVLCVCRTS